MYLNFNVNLVALECPFFLDKYVVETHTCIGKLFNLLKDYELCFASLKIHTSLSGNRTRLVT